MKQRKYYEVDKVQDISEITAEAKAETSALYKKMQGAEITEGFDTPMEISTEVQKQHWQGYGNDRYYFNIIFTVKSRYKHEYKFNAGYIDNKKGKYCVDSNAEINLASKNFLKPAIERIEKIYIAPSPEPKQTITVDGKEYEFRRKIDDFEVLDKVWTDSEGRLFVAVESKDKATNKPYAIVCIKPGEKYVLSCIEWDYELEYALEEAEYWFRCKLHEIEQ